ncbi:CdaR family transcriptional regulator [Evansella halocellulosilytica]|uniref:CdaR family transcriptional regulator n=1 Tax=Evansella halocellulosilytica TaxID=2011013 RepID=UPI000BB8123D|nr:sugar diacid recognition domain-containing protein [Evansella halocellulosilytica]
MYLNKKIAEKIIQDMRSVVDYHINIIDSNGFVIASTNARRVNSYHEAAHMIIRNNYHELIVEYDEQYKGCKSGVNLPIYFSNELIGVVGITGNSQEVAKYARIIQKMTEMIMYEFFDLWNRNNQEQIKLVFANDLISGNFLTSLFDIEERLQQNNLNVKGSFTVALIKYSNHKDKNSNRKLNTVRHNIVKKYISDKLGYRYSLVSYNGEFFVVITNLHLSDLSKELEYLCKKVREIHSVSLLCAIGNTHETYEDIPKSYNEALSIFQYLGDNVGVYQFSQTSLNLTISKIPESYKITLKNQVFSKCNQKEVEEFTGFIKSYFIYNGSLNKLAKKYYIHKNTVQYKIQKIKEKTDYDLRVFNDMVILYLASKF